ncbi:3'(2'),5'-bisphosphate nucleotidase CysQ [Robertkochia solimangrovi]|uniref:3'(2'),5'-bisphosphate nucleotidase CysQ n=1 Tax=Robertkochia solimangrovi TaxID=2213046 RepID=UPI0011806FC5|nr:3'(2'),5'-bisphosphate nucleotidase CysQ [Robertkochia solimangrovi]TRZ46033.1 3'(2'),5'-bisphosphate nucleotidase [Robertkochia solimangrovi]
MDKLIVTAVEAAVLAGKQILKVYESDHQVEIKDDQSPLTAADKASNEEINKALAVTDIPVISEENKLLPYNTRKEWGTCWIVDPLDGTKEFIKKNGEFTVNIALVTDQKPVFGVIYVPVTGELFLGNVTDKKAYKFIATAVEEIPSMKELSSFELISTVYDEDKIRVVGSRSHMNEDTEKYMSQLQQQYKEVEIVSKGSSLKFCLVAEGKADLYPRFAPTMEWDTAAGQAICEAAGFKVVDQKTGEPMLYNRENLLNNYFLVSR